LDSWQANNIYFKIVAPKNLTEIWISGRQITSILKQLPPKILQKFGFLAGK
jgi:hypothetical protein